MRVDNNSALQSDDDAYFSATHKVNVAELVPYVAMPDSPDNAVTIEKVDWSSNSTGLHWSLYRC